MKSIKEIIELFNSVSRKPIIWFKHPFNKEVKTELGKNLKYFSEVFPGKNF